MKSAYLAVLLFIATTNAYYMTSLRTNVGKKGDFGRRSLLFVGNGTCESPETKDGYTTVRCLGPEQPMLPGTTLDAYLLLENPYPEGKRVVAVQQTAQMVAKTGPKSWRPVPLSELYFHHVVPNPRFLLGEGAEVRGSRLRKPMPKPYAYIVNGTEAAEYDTRVTNIQLVNTLGVPENKLQSAYECWCDTEFGRNATRGSLFCCTQRETLSKASYTIYQLEYNVTFRDVRDEDEPLDFFGYDATNGKVEYNIAEPLGPKSNHTLASTFKVDWVCPQNNTLSIVRCTAHQHIGARCMHAYKADTSEHICSSCPLYGKVKDEPGNELGYVVAIKDDDLSPPYKIEPGTEIRVESVYDASQPRLGVMGIMAMWVGGVTNHCERNFTASAVESTQTSLSMDAVQAS